MNRYAEKTDHTHMKKETQKFTILQVKDLVLRAYETGFCDGMDSCDNHTNEDFREYKDAEDYWNKFVEKIYMKDLKL